MKQLPCHLFRVAVEGWANCCYNNRITGRSVCIMVDYANAWPNYYVGLAWLLVFITFVVFSYPHRGRRGGEKR